MLLIEDNDVVQALPADGPDNAFNEGILPWRARRCDNLLNRETPDPSLDQLAIDPISVTLK